MYKRVRTQTHTHKDFKLLLTAQALNDLNDESGNMLTEKVIT